MWYVQCAPFENGTGLKGRSVVQRGEEERGVYEQKGKEDERKVG